MPARVICRSGGGPPTGTPITMMVSAESTAFTVPFEAAISKARATQFFGPDSPSHSWLILIGVII